MNKLGLIIKTRKQIEKMLEETRHRYVMQDDNDKAAFALGQMDILQLLLNDKKEQ